ncbi:MAG: hypothetical protein EOP42_12840 [Sphingobacteriaceae bacterium]|nr:MAG: hypothetical protein EOP42_12840 [Sphingobacteriaceae bacterium]
MKQIFTYIILCIPFLTFAQSNYKKGLVVKTNGEVLNGYINYQEWDRNPKIIFYKTLISDKETLKFKPAGIQSFELVNLENYISYTGRISADKTGFPDLPTGLDTSTRRDTVFLKQIVSGSKVALFSYTDNIKTRFFIVEKGTEPTELIYHQYYTDNNHTVVSTDYRNQLLDLANKYISENHNVTGTINLALYTQSTFEKIVAAINGEAITKRVKNRKQFVRFFAGLALNQTDTKFEGTNPWANSKTSPDYLPKISIGADVFNNPTVQRFVLRGEIAFTAITPKFEIPVYVIGSPDGSQTYTFNQYTTSFTPQILYNIYNRENLKFYLGIGASLNLSTYGNNKITTKNSTFYRDQDKPYTFESFWTNFPVEAGITLNKRIELYATYSYPAVYSTYSYFSVSSRIASLGIHFLLNKK